MTWAREEMRLDRADPAEVRRFDRVDIDLPRATRTPEGYLFAPATRLARVGVQEYQRTDGTKQIELRLPEDVGDEASLATARGKPLVHRHPPNGWVTALTFGERGVGHVENVRMDDAGEFLLGDVWIHREDAVRAVERGDSEISAGYDTLAAPIPGGVFRQEGHRFDGAEAHFVQTRIRYNHFALEPRARANTGDPTRPVRIRLDGAGNQVLDDDTSSAGRREDSVDEDITINGQTFKVPKAVAEKIRAEQKRADDAASLVTAEKTRADSAETKIKDLEPKLSAEKTRADRAEAERDVAKTKASEVEQKRNDAVDTETKAKAEAERFKLMQVVAEASKKPVEELVRLDAAGLRLELVKARRPELDLTGKSPDYVAAVLDLIQSEGEARVDSGAQVAGMLSAVRPAPGVGAIAESPYVKSVHAAHDRLQGRQPAKAGS